MTPTDPTAASSRIADLNGRILAIADEVAEILKVDIPYYFESEAKRRFLGNQTWARALSDAQVKALREALRTEGQALTDATLAALRTLDVWLAGVECEAQPSSLRDNPRVAELLERVGATLRDILQRFDYPAAEGEPIEYREPRRFIGGRHLPALAEKYWKRMAEYRDARTDAEREKAEHEQADLARRWDAI